MGCSYAYFEIAGAVHRYYDSREVGDRNYLARKCGGLFLLRSGNCRQKHQIHRDHTRNHELKCAQPRSCGCGTPKALLQKSHQVERFQPSDRRLSGNSKLLIISSLSRHIPKNSEWAGSPNVAGREEAEEETTRRISAGASGTSADSSRPRRPPGSRTRFTRRDQIGLPEPALLLDGPHHRVSLLASESFVKLRHVLQSSDHAKPWQRVRIGIEV